MKATLIILILLLKLSVSSQNVLTSAGDYSTSSNGSLSWTLGEPISETLSGEQILTQGFQQDYENILSVNHLTEYYFPLVYPNPFNSKLNLDFSNLDFQNEKIELKLSDNSGRIILEDTFQEELFTGNLSNGVYHLEVIIGNSKRFIYKLVKTTN